jgi:phospholipid/cholesterol/gamma-HCH transport system substrate-binding protein
MARTIEGRRRGRAIMRGLTVLALVAAVIAVAVAMFGAGAGGDGYKVTARFQNAGQIVKGGLVEISGKRVGQISDLHLADDGAAEVEISIDEAWTPLPQGTHAQIRQFGLSGPASRYIELRYPRDRERRDAIPDGGVIGLDSTTSNVDLDEVFSIFDKKTRDSLRDAFRGSRRLYAGQSGAARQGWLYLDPSLVSASRLFRELNRDTPELERFLIESSDLVSDVAQRREDLAGLVTNLAETTGAITRPRGALANAISQLPAFMRQANTTYVNLRATLDDLDPLVRDFKPVARQLQPYTREIRELTVDLEPTVRDLARITGRPGRDNDLIDLGRRIPALHDIGVGPVRANGEERRGALPATAEALATSTPRIAFSRPYSVDFAGWLDDFSHSGNFDALGGYSRIGTHVSAFTIKPGLIAPLVPAARAVELQEVGVQNQRNRCPGSVERDTHGDGSTPFIPYEGYNCDPSQRTVGP